MNKDSWLDRYTKEQLHSRILELTTIITEKDVIIDEVVFERNYYKQLYFDHRAKMDEGD